MDSFIMHNLFSFLLAFLSGERLICGFREVNEYFHLVFFFGTLVAKGFSMRDGMGDA